MIPQCRNQLAIRYSRRWPAEPMSSQATGLVHRSCRLPPATRTLLEGRKRNLGAAGPRDLAAEVLEAVLERATPPFIPTTRRDGAARAGRGTTKIQNRGRTPKRVTTARTSVGVLHSSSEPARSLATILLGSSVARPRRSRCSPAARGRGRHPYYRSVEGES